MHGQIESYSLSGGSCPNDSCGPRLCVNGPKLLRDHYDTHGGFKRLPLPFKNGSIEVKERTRPPLTSTTREKNLKRIKIWIEYRAHFTTKMLTSRKEK